MYTPVTSERRTLDFELPTYINLGGEAVEVPESIRQKDPHYLVNNDGQAVRVAWISAALAHTLNAERLDDPSIKTSELRKAISAIEDNINFLVKKGVIKSRKGPGAMSFTQANENVPKNSIVISERTFDVLCRKNPAWKKAKTVMAIRFPNLGPGTTQKLNLVVNGNPRYETTELSPTSLGSRFPKLADLLISVTEEEIVVDESSVMDAFYLHPSILKNCMEGDGDGDQVFICIEDRGKPIFKEIDFTRSPSSIKAESIDKLFKKAVRCGNQELVNWLPTYFDEIPIGPVTYNIRFDLHNALPHFKDSKHPMHDAWKTIAPIVFPDVEFVLDIRKGEWSDEEIERRLKKIGAKSKQIQIAQENGNWFAKTVPTKTILDIPGFIQTFPTLQAYLNYITKQPTNHKLSDLI